MGGLESSPSSSEEDGSKYDMIAAGSGTYGKIGAGRGMPTLIVGVHWLADWLQDVLAAFFLSFVRSFERACCEREGK